MLYAKHSPRGGENLPGCRLILGIFKLRHYRPKLFLIDGINGSAENDDDARMMETLRGTDVRPLIPEDPAASGDEMSAVWLTRAAASAAHSALYAGPWAAAYPDFIEMFARAVGEALDEEDHTVLIVRE